MTRTHRTPLFAAILIGLCWISARAQFSYKTGVDVAGFAVTVTDRQGEPVRDLKADDFEVKEDGTLQAVTYFSTSSGEEAVPLHVGLLFDTSESMQKDLAFSRNAAIKFLNTFPKAVDFSLVEFSDEVRAARFSQAEFARLVERIRSGKAKGRTSLYDAVSVYLGSAFDQTGRKVLRSTPTATTHRALARGMTRCACCALQMSPCTRSGYSPEPAPAGCCCSPGCLKSPA